MWFSHCKSSIHGVAYLNFAANSLISVRAKDYTAEVTSADSIVTVGAVQAERSTESKGKKVGVYSIFGQQWSSFNQYFHTF